MKRAFSLILVGLMVFMLASCSSAKPDEEDINSIVASYSIKSENGDFIVEVQPNMGGIYDEIYSADGIEIKFYGKSDEIYDKDGNKISRESLKYGDALEVQFNGKLSKKNPNVIKAYKVIKMV